MSVSIQQLRSKELQPGAARVLQAALPFWCLSDNSRRDRSDATIHLWCKYTFSDAKVPRNPPVEAYPNWRAIDWLLLALLDPTVPTQQSRIAPCCLNFVQTGVLWCSEGRRQEIEERSEGVSVSVPCFGDSVSDARQTHECRLRPLSSKEDAVSKLFDSPLCAAVLGIFDHTLWETLA